MLTRRLIPCLALLALPRLAVASENFFITDMGGRGTVELTEWLAEVEWPSVTYEENQARWTPLSASFRVPDTDQSEAPLFSVLNRQVIAQIRAGRGRGSDRFSVHLGRGGMSVRISGARLLHVHYDEELVHLRIEFSSAIMT